jgi:hypothetical protein
VAVVLHMLRRESICRLGAAPLPHRHAERRGDAS